MGRNKLDEKRLRRRFTFFLSPDVAEALEMIPKGVRGRRVDGILRLALLGRADPPPPR